MIMEHLGMHSRVEHNLHNGVTVNVIPVLDQQNYYFTC